MKTSAMFRLALKLIAPDIVRSIYVGILGREPDPEGLKTYCNELLRTGNLAGMVADIATSREAWEKQLGAHLEELVRDTYLGLLRREPDEDALSTYVEELRNTRDLPGLLATIDRSQEHWERLLPARAEQLVSAVYQGLLNRELDEEAQRTYVTQLRESGDLPRVLATIDRSQEHWERLLPARAEQLVSAVYQGLLNRDLDEEAQRKYVTQLREKGNVAQLLATIARSEEHWELLIGLRAEDLVRAAYRGLLKRDPDEEGLAAHVGKLLRHRDPAALISEVARSDEHWSMLTTQKSWPHPTLSYDHPAIVFLHIEKTAGTSVQNMLLEAFPKEQVYREHRDTLYRRSPAELSAYSVFAGHFNHDSLALIPRRELQLITFVREPKKRLASLYHFWRAHEPSHPNYGGGLALANELTMAEFFGRPEFEWDGGVSNHMTWAIMGERWWQEWQQALRSAQDANAVNEILSTAIRPAVRQRLREFAFLGIQEDFNRSVELLFCILGRPLPALRADHSVEALMQANPHFKKSLERQPMDSATERLAERLVTIDNIVYAEAKIAYTRQLSKFSVLRSAEPAPEPKRWVL